MTSERRKLPTFLIVGAAKAGTSSLYQYLRSHPQVYMSPIKEPNYFSRDTWTGPPSSSAHLTDAIRSNATEVRGLNFGARVGNLEGYCSLFDRAVGRIAIGECSTSYLYSHKAARKIRQLLPSAKIVMVLRHPVERAFSHWLMDLRIGVTQVDFLEEVEKDHQELVNENWPGRGYVVPGMYFEQVKRYCDEFPAAQIKIYLFEDLKTDFDSFVRSLYRFVDVDPDFHVASTAKLNTAAIPRSKLLNTLLFRLGVKGGFLPTRLATLAKFAFYTGNRLPQLTTDDRSRLNPIFREDIEKLQDLINRDLSAWLR